MDHDPPTDIVEPLDGRGAICREILEALPRWFGIPESVETYVRDAELLPMMAARAGGRWIGFVSLRVQTPAATEAYVLGVKPD
jgi:hypothetical protein